MDEGTTAGLKEEQKWIGDKYNVKVYEYSIRE